MKRAMMRAFRQEYSPPPHSRASRRQMIEARKIAKAGRSSIASLFFRLDFGGDFRLWMKKSTTTNVGAERMGFIQKILAAVSTKKLVNYHQKAHHRQVVPEMMPPPMSGPAMKATPFTAPTIPLNGAIFDLGTELDKIVRTPDKMPPAPSPATARPLAYGSTFFHPETSW